MYTPDQYSLTFTQRALVTYSNSATGEIKVKIPSVLGSTSEIFISKVGRQANSGVWSVPTVGSQIVVSYDDQHLTNVFWMQTDAVAGPQGLQGASIADLDGGTPSSIYGGITSIDCGGV